MTDERLRYEEERLDIEAEEVEDAFRTGALTEAEARRMHAAIDRKRRALYARQEQEEG